MNLKPNEVAINLPFGLGSIKFKANEEEINAAWILFVEFSTRVSSRSYDKENSRLRSALDSLYSLVLLTRKILRSAGPNVAHSEKSLGPIAIAIINEGLAPFLTRWHYKLEAYEEQCPKSTNIFQYEREWKYFDLAVEELEVLREDLVVYINALGDISGANISKQT